VFARVYGWLAQPARARQIRRVLIFLALIWLVVACSRLIWALLPGSEVALPEDVVVLNPVEASGNGQLVESVDINKMISWHLLGKADEVNAESVDSTPLPAQETGREGIEEGARESRLDLRLRGIVASTEDGLGHAIIEHKSKQQVYAVEDKLPISGRVTLAKVMVDRVVIDNRGTYELLILFEDSTLQSQLPAKVGGELPPALSAAARAVDMRGDVAATAVAQSFRQQLYQDPQSLASLVRISAVRESGTLRGYKLAPGADSAQFKQLGFQAGDVVTSINGIALNDPGNTVRLYQLMRSAREATFDLERAGEQLTVSVTLDAN